MATITYKQNGENVQANIRFTLTELVPEATLAEFGTNEMLSEAAEFLRLHFEGATSVIDGTDVIAIKTYGNQLSDEIAAAKIAKAIESAQSNFT